MAESYLPLSHGYQRSLAQLRKVMGRGPLYEFLKGFATAERVYQKWDFTENAALGDTRLVPANSGGTSAANFAIKAATRNGVIEGDTGTDDNGSISLVGDVQWFGDDNAGMAMRYKIDVAATDNNYELGFIDAVPGSNASGVNDDDTPTMAAADAALLSYDSDETLDTIGCFTIGSTSNQDVKKTNTGIVPVNATWYIAAVQLVGNSAYFFHGPTADTLKLVGRHDDDPQGNLEGGVALAPWFYCRTRTGTARFPQIDWIEVWSDRN